ncbi:tetratricopeptide repeat protein [Rosettibacter firmus]|uniref:tetratricopeptide repeat protein n=1 Tax=Rosettibacter firmus TaxID=3111522 RepID=UPI00336BE428
MTKNKIFILTLLFLLASTITAQNNLLDNRLRLAQSYEEAGQLDKAEAILRELQNSYPENYTYFDAYTKILIKQKKYTEATQLIEKRISLTPQDINLFGLLGSVYFMADNVSKAYDAWERGLRVSPNLIIAYRVMANYAIESRAFEKAIDILQRGKKISNDQELFSIDLINIYLANMRYKDAGNEICDLIIKNPEQISNIKARINFYSDNKDAINQFITSIENKIKDNPKPALYDMLAYYYSLIGKYDYAFQRLIEYENKINGNGNTIISFANNAYQNKVYDVALKAYDYLIKNSNNKQLLPLWRFYYASSLEMLFESTIKSENELWKPYNNFNLIKEEKLRDVINSYESIIKDYPENSLTPQILFRMAEIYFNRVGNYQKAESLYTLINLRASNTEFSVLAFLQKGKISILNNQLEDAKSYYEKVLINNRSNLNHQSEANYYLGKINFWSGNFTDAIKYLSETTKILSNDFANDALELISLINFSKSDSLNLIKYAAADLMLYQKKFREAAREFKDLSNTQTFSLISEYAKYKLAETLIAMNDLPTSIEVLEELAESSKTGIFSDKSLFLLGKIYHFGIKDKTKAVSIYQKLLEKFPNSLYFEQVREYLNELQTNNG